ncbi:hypothetical protein AB0M46_44910 [Dactylosporangium sp. NPDC051485]|uniref:hypothetical protein n=1 Tax=Dactylosporangium sp. NPDC051485 TaxID=3154846 RepID=UPI00342B2818
MTGQYSVHPADTGTAPATVATSADTPQPCTCQQRAERAEARLAAHEAVVAQIRNNVRDGVAAGNFDLDVTNDLLAALGLEPLPRYWTVKLSVALTVTVAAADGDDAFAAARDLVENLLDQAEVVDDYDVNDVDEAIPGGVADEPDARAAEQRRG